MLHLEIQQFVDSLGDLQLAYERALKNEISDADVEEYEKRFEEEFIGAVRFAVRRTDLLPGVPVSKDGIYVRA